VTQVTLATSGSQADVTGLIQLTVTDPASEVASVGFYLTGRDKHRVGPLPADRNPSADTYEKDVLLDARVLTRVEPEVVLSDGTVVRGPVALLGVRFEPLTAGPGRLASVNVTAQASRIDVVTALDSAVIWKCYARKGAPPTIDGLDGSPPARAYLRFQGDAALLSFSMSLDPGTWMLVTVGYNGAGQRGPAITHTVEVAA
jgi:hypothetical protein